MGKKISVTNTFATPISPMAQHMYNDLLKRNEGLILDEADPKVTYITDSNMEVAKFIALSGDDDKRIFGKEVFNFLGQKLELPYEKVSYNVVDIATGKVTPKVVKYLDTQDTEIVSEIYKEFYRLATFLISQEIAMKGLLPTLTEKGEYIVDQKTGLPMVGAQYLEHYFGLTHAGSQEEKARANAIADVNRWSFGSLVYQMKVSHSMWKEIHNKFKSGDIQKYGNGPTVDNIGVSDFHVASSVLNPTTYVGGTTTPERTTFEFDSSKTFKSDIPNMLVGTQANFTGTPAPTAYAGQPNVQPSVQAAPVQQGPVQPVEPKGTTKRQK
jgi:hypothetical protein